MSDWLQQLQWGSLLDTVALIAASVLCITIHETSHGLVALWMGDDTAKRAGRLTLNPLKHIDLMGLVMMALVKFGWAKPVPIDMRRFKNPKLGMVLTALAGPVSNFLLAFLGLILLFILTITAYGTAAAPYLEYVLRFLLYAVQISVTLGVFNLFPIPPMDGSKVLFSFLPNTLYYRLMRYERYGFLILSALLLLDVLDGPLSMLSEAALSILSAGASWIALSLIQLFM